MTNYTVQGDIRRYTCRGCSRAFLGLSRRPRKYCCRGCRANHVARMGPKERAAEFGPKVKAEAVCCEQCGVTFTTRREEARFCSARCRVTWHRKHGTCYRKPPVTNTRNN